MNFQIFLKKKLFEQTFFKAHLTTTRILNQSTKNTIHTTDEIRPATVINTHHYKNHSISRYQPSPNAGSIS